MPKYPYRCYQTRVSTDITGVEQVGANDEKYCDRYPAGFKNYSFSIFNFHFKKHVNKSKQFKPIAAQGVWKAEIKKEIEFFGK